MTSRWRRNKDGTGRSIKLIW